MTDPAAAIRSRRGLVHLLLIALAVGIAFVAGRAFDWSTSEPVAADHIAERPDNAQVRIAARHTGDGRVEVALQELSGASWSERHLPDARFLAVDALAGEWRTSSPIPVGTFWSPVRSVPLPSGTEGMFGTPVFGQDRPLCVIGHGDRERDFFWSLLSQGVDNASYIARLNVRTAFTSDSAAQAAAIRQCTADGAWGIAATLADVEAVGDALREAHAAGVNVLTYNSGARHSREVHAFAHVGLDDLRGGELVGERLNDSGVRGEVWCVVHEASNVGLEERCDGIASTYTGGTVTRVPAHSPELLTEAAVALTNADLGAVITLNTNTSLWALGVAQQAGLTDLYLAGFGTAPQLYGAVAVGVMQFIVWDHPTIQGMLAVNLLLSPLYLVGGTTIEFGGAHIVFEPELLDTAEIRAIAAAIDPQVLLGLLEAAGVTPEQAAAMGLFDG